MSLMRRDEKTKVAAMMRMRMNILETVMNAKWLSRVPAMALLNIESACTPTDIADFTRP